MSMLYHWSRQRICQVAVFVLDASLCVPTLCPQSPCLHRGFLFLQQHQALPKGTFNIWHYHPSPHTILNRFGTQISLKYFHLQQSQSSHFFSSTDTSISSTYLPHTSLPIPITDAISPSKFHCYLLPLIWDLIGATIKGRGQ